jgi:hypothetical protein
MEVSSYLFLSVSALEGAAVGLLFLHWLPLASSGIVLASVAVVFLENNGFAWVPALALTAVSLSCNQLLYFVGFACADYFVGEDRRSKFVH